MFVYRSSDVRSVEMAIDETADEALDGNRKLTSVWWISLDLRAAEPLSAR